MLKECKQNAIGKLSSLSNVTRVKNVISIKNVAQSVTDMRISKLKFSKCIIH
jgi:hypothetical protein